MMDRDLAQVPDSVFQHLELKHLILNGNNLTELPHAIGGISNSELLEVDRNVPTSLPESIGDLGTATTCRQSTLRGIN